MEEVLQVGLECREFGFVVLRGGDRLGLGGRGWGCNWFLAVDLVESWWSCRRVGLCRCLVNEEFPVLVWTPERIGRDDGLGPLRIGSWCALEENFASAASLDHPLGSISS